MFSIFSILKVVGPYLLFVFIIGGQYIYYNGKIHIMDSKIVHLEEELIDMSTQRDNEAKEKEAFKSESAARLNRISSMEVLLKSKEEQCDKRNSACEKSLKDCINQKPHQKIGEGNRLSNEDGSKIIIDGNSYPARR